jgi:putative FmdB family regulatory protein
MPTYPFQCKACDHKFEKVILISKRDEPLAEPCPECGETGKVERDWSQNDVAICDPVRIGVRRPDKAFRDGVLGKLAKKPVYNKNTATGRLGMAIDKSRNALQRGDTKFSI